MWNCFFLFPDHYLGQDVFSICSVYHPHLQKHVSIGTIPKYRETWQMNPRSSSELSRFQVWDQINFLEVLEQNIEKYTFNQIVIWEQEKTIPYRSPWEQC